MKIKGAIFDLDGVILDSMAIWDRAGELFLKEFNRNPKSGLSEKLKTLSLNEAAGLFRDHYNIQLGETEIIENINRIVGSEYLNSVQLKGGVRSFLDSLYRKNIKMCIATASDRAVVEKVLKRLGIFDYFIGIVTCGEVGRGKNYPDVYFRALDLLKLNISQTVLFEDALHAIRTAKEAGFYVAAVYDKSADPDKVNIRALSDIYLNTIEEWQEYV